tara:strand:+ start:3567 stop:5126 length:1560 start_codon:yes stop_codon:yes gene_type:complete
MSDLKGRSIASTYKNLIQSSGEISSSSLKQIQSGSGNNVAMKLSTDKAVFPKVGIGNTGSNPDGLLHVLSTSAGSVTSNSLADEIVLESSTNTGLSILSGASHKGNMFFGDANDNDVGKISYNHADDSFSFSTNGSVSMTLDKNSNLKVNGTVSQSDDRFELVEYFEKVPSLGIADTQVTQSSSATNTVTLNAKYGVITMQSVDLAATDTVQFTFNNDHIYGATSQVLVSIIDSNINTADNAIVSVMVLDVADGSCKIRIGTNGTDIADQVFKLFFVIDPYITPNQNFVLGGTNSGSVQVSGNAGRPTNGFAGIKLVTGTTDNDFTVLTTRDGETEIPTTFDSSAWSSVPFGTENKIQFDCGLSTGGTITNYAIWAGLKLTEVGAYATDANQAYFLYATDDDLGALTTNGNLHFVYSVGGTDYITDLGISVVASTVYKLRISIDENRKISVFVNNVQYGLTSTPTTTTAGGVTESVSTAKSLALTDDIDLLPFVGVQALSASGRGMQIGFIKMSRDLFE